MHNKHIFLRNGRFILILLFILFALTTFTVSAAPEAHVEAATTSNVQQTELNTSSTPITQDTNATSICTSFVSIINKWLGTSYSEPDTCKYDDYLKRGYAWSD